MEDWVGHITSRERRSRASRAWRLTRLGWTNEEAGNRLGVSEGTIRGDRRDSDFGNLTTALGARWNDQRIAQEARRLDLPLTEAWAAALVRLRVWPRTAAGTLGVPGIALAHLGRLRVLWWSLVSLP